MQPIFISIPGKGITGIVAGRAVVMGNAKLMADRADDLRKDGATALFLGVDGKPGGIIAVADPIKPTTVDALEILRAEGIHIVMLTGDNRATAEAVARKIGTEDIEADELPQDKNRIVRKPRAERKIAAMPAMASTTPRGSRKRMSAQRWEPATRSRFAAQV